MNEIENLNEQEPPELIFAHKLDSDLGQLDTLRSLPTPAHEMIRRMRLEVRKAVGGFNSEYVYDWGLNKLDYVNRTSKYFARKVMRVIRLANRAWSLEFYLFYVYQAGFTFNFFSWAYLSRLGFAFSVFFLTSYCNALAAVVAGFVTFRTALQAMYVNLLQVFIDSYFSPRL